MKVQALTFRVDGSPNWDMLRQSDIIGLAVREFPGVVVSHCITDPCDNVFGGVIVWEDARSLAQFRHSELYARLMLHPYLVDPRDEDVSIDRHAQASDLLLVA